MSRVPYSWIYPELWLACAYADHHDLNGPTHSYVRPHKWSFSPSRGEKEISKILDTLAECCVHQVRNQRVAFSITVAPACVTLYVSQSGGSLHRIVDHLHDTLTLMRRMRNSTKKTPSLSLNRDLEIHLTKFSIEKLQRRMLKHSETFLAEYVPLFTVPALQYKYPKMRTHFARLLSFADDLRVVRQRLSLQRPERDLHWLVEQIAVWYKEWRSGEDSLNVLSKMDGIAKSSRFSLFKYLQKIFYIHEHCLTLMRIAKSGSRLSILLDSGCVIEAVPPMQRHIILDTHFDNFLPHLQSMHFRDNEMPAIHGRMVEKLVRVIKSLGVKVSANADHTTLDFGTVDVHPECVLLAHHKRSQMFEPFPYVGTSKTPCRGCQYYLDAFSSHIFLHPPRFGFRGPGMTESKVPVICFPWAAPLVGPMEPPGTRYSDDDLDAMKHMSVQYLRCDLSRCLK